MSYLLNVSDSGHCAARGLRRRRWRDLSDRQRTKLLVVGSIELSLTATAVVDLFRRPPETLRGPKVFWWPAIFVQPVGPIAYLMFGRRRAGIQSEERLPAPSLRTP